MNIMPSIITCEFIGKNAEIVKSTNRNYVGIFGKVIDETKKTFMILSAGKPKMIVKNISVFHFSFSDGTVVEIDGRLLVGSPEDRLKKTIKRLW